MPITLQDITAAAARLEEPLGAGVGGSSGSPVTITGIGSACCGLIAGSAPPWAEFTWELRAHSILNWMACMSWPSLHWGSCPPWPSVCWHLSQQ